LLYVSRSTRTQVIDCASGKVVQTIPDTAGVHGIALAPKLQRGFTSNGQGNSVTVFDLKTFAVLGTVKVGNNPDCILYDASSGKILTFNGHGSNVSVFDASTGFASPQITTIPLPGKPEFAATDEQGHIFVNLEDQSEIAVIDAKTWKVVNVWKLDGGEEPSGLAIDAVHHRLFAGCHNEVMAVVDSQTGKTLATPPIGKGVDACGFDPGTGEAFASCGDGTLTVVKETSPGKFEVTQKVPTHAGARTMGLDPTTHTIYMPTAEMLPAAPATNSSRPARPSPKPDSFMIVVVSH
jgi:DNA-binding beta-propeller fold protein YncE